MTDTQILCNECWDKARLMKDGKMYLEKIEWVLHEHTDATVTISPAYPRDEDELTINT